MEISSGTTTVLCLLALIFFSSSSSPVAALRGAEVEKNHHVVNVTPIVLVETIPSDGVVRCARVPVSGISRLKLGNYSNARRISVVPSNGIPEKSHGKIHICLHSNSSLELCHCGKDYWESIHNGIWSSIISPYQDKYIDIKFSNNLYGSVVVSAKIEFHRWRLLSLAIGFILLLLAPIVSSWVPFYYSSSMAIGVCLVVIIILFQGMKLLPTGRKNALYSTLCGLALGAGSFLLNRLSIFVNSILINFGFSEEMHNPVLVFLAVGIVLAGAGFGYWLVRKFVVSEDGSVDVGVAQFVKWALRVIAVTFIFQSTLDTPLVMGLLVSFVVIYLSFTSMKWDSIWDHTYSGNGSLMAWKSERMNKKHKRAEFLSRPGAMHSQGTLWGSPRSVSPRLKSHLKGTPSPSTVNVRDPSTYYSTFHKTPDEKKFSEEGWKEFTEASTRQAMAELASSPEFTEWIMTNADRIKLHHGDSSEESIGSGSDSTYDNQAESSSRRGLLKWQPRG
ncbi:hypothetical protein F511_22815 [Dorcoceras hygrometricum]|uniref:Uncharacterized protein n=1 Tax=Dorcoceras hygrometricum TaxID=472368 RepID=A0A2Z7C1V3_9LAMI|nr:hypothetical protein F511_22815 [Dorcoceras hygrometricum]